MSEVSVLVWGSKSRFWAVEVSGEELWGRDVLLQARRRALYPVGNQFVFTLGTCVPRMTPLFQASSLQSAPNGSRGGGSKHKTPQAEFGLVGPSGSHRGKRTPGK